MEPLFDLHCHMLSHCDDGAVNDEEMFGMLEAAYADGIRSICLTPHFHYSFYGDNRAASEAAFGRLTAYVAEHHPEMQLFLGNELFYHHDAIEYLKTGECRTLAGGRYLLFDFSQGVRLRVIQNAVKTIVSHGYRPVLAHVERYSCLGRNIKEIRKFMEFGCVIQVNAGSLFGEWGIMAKWRARKLVDLGMVHIISTDAHHQKTRRPELSRAAEWVQERYEDDYVRDLFYRNAERVVKNEIIGW